MRLPVRPDRREKKAEKTAFTPTPRPGSKTSVRRDRKAAASIELVMASAVAIPIAGGLLFLGFQICRYVFAALSGLLSMPFV